MAGRSNAQSKSRSAFGTGGIKLVQAARLSSPAQHHHHPRPHGQLQAPLTPFGSWRARRHTIIVTLYGILDHLHALSVGGCFILQQAREDLTGRFDRNAHTQAAQQLDGHVHLTGRRGGRQGALASERPDIGPTPFAWSAPCMELVYAALARDCDTVAVPRHHGPLSRTRAWPTRRRCWREPKPGSLLLIPTAPWSGAMVSGSRASSTAASSTAWPSASWTSRTPSESPVAKYYEHWETTRLAIFGEGYRQPCGDRVAL